MYKNPGRDKSEASARQFSEAVESYNNLFGQYNDLKKDADVKGEENIRLKKRVEDLEALMSVWEKELKDAQVKAEYYEDKLTSMKLFTTVKVQAEMARDYSEGKASSWDLVAASSAWEEMKLLYSDSKGEDDQNVEEDVGSSRVSLSGTQGAIAGSRAGGEEVVVKNVVE